MSRRIPLLLALLVAVAAWPSTASAGETCTARGARVVLENDQARVFSVRGRGELVRTWYGCLRGARPSVLGRDLDPRSDEDTHTSNTLFRLTGPSVAWVQTSSSDFGVGEFGRAVLGRSLRRGGPRVSADVSDFRGIDALAVRADAATAWVATTGTTYREVDVFAPGARSATALAYGPDIDPSTLAIDDAGVHWTQGGSARTGEVRPPADDVAPDPAARPGPQTLDPSYNTCGVLQPPLPQRVGAAARAIARGPGGSIAVAGSAAYGRGSGSIMLTRLHPDGSLDPAFGQGGAVVTPVPRPAGSQATVVTGVAVQSDEKIVVGGYVRLENPNDSRSFLARYNPDGSLDAGFGQGGIVQDALPGARSGQIDDVAVTSDGAIVAAGLRNAASEFGDRSQDRFTVARYTTAGTLDPAFGTGGIATVETPAGGRAADIEPAGDKLVVAGGAGEGFALVRLNPNGTPDASFGDGGRTFASPPGLSQLEAISVLGDGRIAAVGTVSNVRGRDQLALARYTADGRLDPGFGVGGLSVDRYATAPGGVFVQDDGRFVVSGGSQFAGFTAGGGLLRYDSDGSRDDSFGVSGALVSFGSYGVDSNAILPQPDGTVLAAQSHGGDFGVARFVVGDPALGAAAGGPRVCSVSVSTKTLGQLLRRGSIAKYGKLRVVFRRVQAGGVTVQATARVGSRTVALGRATRSSPTAGTDIVEVRLSSRAYAALRSARRAEITVTLTGAEGGANATGTKTLTR